MASKESARVLLEDDPDFVRQITEGERETERQQEKYDKRQQEKREQVQRIVNEEDVGSQLTSLQSPVKQSPAKKKSGQVKSGGSKKTGSKSGVSSVASQSGWKQKKGVAAGVERSKQPLVTPVVVTISEEESQKTGQHLQELQARDKQACARLARAPAKKIKIQEPKKTKRKATSQRVASKGDTKRIEESEGASSDTGRQSKSPHTPAKRRPIFQTKPTPPQIEISSDSEESSSGDTNDESVGGDLTRELEVLRRHRQQMNLIASRPPKESRPPPEAPPRQRYERSAKRRTEAIREEHEAARLLNWPRENEYQALREKYGSRPYTEDSHLAEDEEITYNSWRKVIHEGVTCGQLHPRDVVAAMYFPAPNATYQCKARLTAAGVKEKTRAKDFTIAAFCGHITNHLDPHPVCVAGQVLATGTLCCVESGNLCDIGWADEKLSGNSYNRWRKHRYGILKRWINDGSDVVVQLMGPANLVAGAARLRLEYAIVFGLPVLETARDLWIQCLEANTKRSQHVDDRIKAVQEAALIAREQPIPPTCSVFFIATWIWSNRVPMSRWLQLTDVKKDERSTTPVGAGYQGVVDLFEKRQASMLRKQARLDKKEQRRAEREAASAANPPLKKTKVTGQEAAQSSELSMGSNMELDEPEDLQPLASLREKNVATREQQKELLREANRQRYLQPTVSPVVTSTPSKMSTSAATEAIGEMDCSEITTHSGEPEMSTQAQASASLPALSLKKESGSSDVFRHPVPPAARTRLTSVSGSDTGSAFDVFTPSSSRPSTPQGFGVFANPRAVRRVRALPGGMGRVVTSKETSYNIRRVENPFDFSDSTKNFEDVQALMAEQLDARHGGLDIPPRVLQSQVHAAWLQAEDQLRQQVAASDFAPRATPADFFTFEAPSAYVYGDNLARAVALDLPREHVPHTPDFLNRTSALHTTFGALTQMEVATKVAVNDVSVVAALVDKMEQTIDFLGQHARAASKVREYISNLKLIVSDSIDKLAKTSCYNALMAQYNKRYSLLEGAHRDVKRAVLAKPYGEAKDALGGEELPTPVKSYRREQAQQPQFSSSLIAAMGSSTQASAPAEELSQIGGPLAGAPPSTSHGKDVQLTVDSAAELAGLRAVQQERDSTLHESASGSSPFVTVEDAEVRSALSGSLHTSQLSVAGSIADSKKLLETVTQPFSFFGTARATSSQASLEQKWSPQTKQMLDSITSAVMTDEAGGGTSLTIVEGDTALKGAAIRTLEFKEPPKSLMPARAVSKSTGEELPRAGVLTQTEEPLPAVSDEDSDDGNDLQQLEANAGLTRTEVAEDTEKVDTTFDDSMKEVEKSGDTTVVEVDDAEESREEDMDVEEQAAGDVQPTASFDLRLEMQADSTKHVAEQLATVVRDLETPEGVRELRRMSTELTSTVQQPAETKLKQTEQQVAAHLSIEGESSDIMTSTARLQVEKSGKVAEDTFASPADAQTDDSTTELRGSESRASDVILDIHGTCDEFDSEVEEEKIETAEQLGEPVEVVRDDRPVEPQATSQSVTPAALRPATSATSVLTTVPVDSLKEVTVSVQEDERRVEFTKPLETMTVWELIAAWNAEKNPTREFVCKLLVNLTDPTSDFASFLHNEGRRIAEYDFAREVAAQRPGAVIKEEPYDKGTYYTPEQRRARQKARAQQYAPPKPDELIDVEELEEGEVESRPTSATTFMEQEAASKGDVDLRVEQARAAKLQQQQQLQSQQPHPHGQQQQQVQSQQFLRHPRLPIHQQQQQQWRSPPRQQQRPHLQQEVRPSARPQKHSQKKK